MQTFEERIKTQLGDLVFKLLQGQHTIEQQAADLETAKQTIADRNAELAAFRAVPARILEFRDGEAVPVTAGEAV